jgi:phage terminase large subunit-like protein
LTIWLPGEPRGEQRPSVLTRPPFTSSSGEEAVELARRAELILDPWQVFSLDVILAERPDLKWAAFETGELVPRQNGKGGVIEAISLAALFLFGERLIAHSAHEFKTSQEGFLRLMALIENTDELRRRCKKPRTSHGEEGFETLDGHRLRFVARSRQSLRGFTGDRLILDEAQQLSRQAMGAVLPTLSARPNPQVNYFGTPPEDGNQSDQWESVRARGQEGGDPQLAWLEWTARQVDDEGGRVPVDLDDREAWRRANPALGIRITSEAIERERLTLGDEEFGRERLCLWEGGAGQTVLDIDVWAGLEDLGSRPGDPVTFGIDIPPDRKSASIGVAGWRADGRMHVEVIEERSGTAWVVGRAVELDEKWTPNGFLLDPVGPAGALIVPLTKAGIEPVLIGGREMTQACGAFYAGVMAENPEERTIRHLGQPELNAAVDGARKRNLSDAWAWHRRDSAVNIAPLVAVTLAAHGVDKKPKRRRRTGRAMSV